jgi:hypothetical protein
MTSVSITESDLGDFKDRVALVTGTYLFIFNALQSRILTRIIGGAKGIGKAIVQLLSELGSMVVFCDLDDTDGVALERQLGL